MPHTLLIIEAGQPRSARSRYRPHSASHRLTVGDPAPRLALEGCRRTAGDNLSGWPIGGQSDGRPVERAWGHLRGQAYGRAWTETQRWLLREYVRKVGYYAIELYSGRLSLPIPSRPPNSRHFPSADMTRAATASAGTSTVCTSWCWVAQCRASPAVNALFGRLAATTDVLPDTTMGLTPIGWSGKR